MQTLTGLQAELTAAKQQFDEAQQRVNELNNELNSLNIRIRQANKISDFATVEQLQPEAVELSKRLALAQQFMTTKKAELGLTQKRRDDWQERIRANDVGIAELQYRLKLGGLHDERIARAKRDLVNLEVSRQTDERKLAELQARRVGLVGE